MDRNALITYYWSSGYKRKEVCLFLEHVHGIKISISYLKVILRRLNLKRYGVESPFNTIIDAIKIELDGGGAGCGYRSMHKRLICDHGLKISRNTVMLLMRIIDPEGVDFRQKKRLRRRQYMSEGPNFAVHIDGYDKLKHYGFCIHGCIDGFSRKILWLKVSSTNNNPKVIAGYYMEYVKEIQGVPRLVRADFGTENVNIETLQKTLRNHDDDMAGLKSFQYGKSTRNQRIERWWGSLRPNMQPFRNVFHDISDAGIYDPSDEIEKACLQFCFMDLIQIELDRVQVAWNQHRIRPVKNSETIGGIPDMLYQLPETFGARDHKFAVNLDELDDLEEEFIERPTSCNAVLNDLYEAAANENNWNKPESIDGALDLYALLADHCFEDLRE